MLAISRPKMEGIAAASKPWLQSPCGGRDVQNRKQHNQDSLGVPGMV
jgi:hypothetical protein